MAKYKLRNTPFYASDGITVESVIEDILDTELKHSIPKDPMNTDYVEYLAWVDAGNTADAADTPPPLNWTDIRADRDQRLKETDWTQMPDVPQETIWKWKTYRQDLRDIPQKQTDPNNITWPTKPS